MTHDSPLWAFEREVIFEVANFKEEVLMSLKGRGGEEGEEGILKDRDIDLSNEDFGFFGPIVY